MGLIDSIKNKKILVKVSVFLTSAYLCFLALDALTYFLFVQERYEFEVGLFKNDDAKRYALTPNFEGFLYHRAGTSPVSTNSRGYRGPEWKLDRSARFMVVGDSMTFGIPLNYEDGFVHKTQKKVGEKAEILNLGVPGYGTPHILEVVKENCAVISPKHIFYMYYVNDTKFNNINKNYFTVVDGYLVTSVDKGGNPRSVDELRNKLHEIHKGQSWNFLETLRLINIRIFLSERGLHPRQLLEKHISIDTAGYLQSNNDGYNEEYTRLGLRDILEMKAVSEKCGANFTMVILTGYAEAFYGVIEPATERLLGKLGDSVEIIDIRKFTRKGINLTQWYDGHYGPAGTDLVSNVLSGYILGRYPELRSTIQK